MAVRLGVSSTSFAPEAILAIRVLAKEAGLDVSVVPSGEGTPGAVDVKVDRSGLDLLQTSVADACLQLCLVGGGDTLRAFVPSDDSACEGLLPLLTLASEDLLAAVTAACGHWDASWAGAGSSEEGADGEALTASLSSVLRLVMVAYEQASTMYGVEAPLLLDLLIACSLRPWVARGQLVPATAVDAEARLSTTLSSWEPLKLAHDTAVCAALDCHPDAVLLVEDDGLSPWVADVGARRPVQPVDIIRLAADFSIDINKEACLLWLCRRLLSTELPPSWRRVSRVVPETALSSSERTVTFQNVLDGREVPTHPGTEFLLHEIDTARHRAALLIERGVDPAAVVGVPSLGGLWMPFQATPSLYQLLQLRYGSGEPPEARNGDDVASSPHTYYFDFLSRTLALALPGGSALVPMPPSEAAVRSTFVGGKGGAGRASSKSLTRDKSGTGPVGGGASASPASLGKSGASFAVSATDSESGRLAGSSLLSRSARPGTATAGVPSGLRAPVLLHFTTWWSELETLRKEGADGSSFRRSRLSIAFNTVDNSCEVSLSGSDEVVLVQSISDSFGRARECWDLHLGAQVVILGRRVTLKQASVETCRWIDSCAGRFRKAQADLMEELVKYDLAAPKVQLRPGKPPSGTGDASGSTNLRELLANIDKLRKRLCQFRPKRAEEIISSVFDA